MWLPFNVYQVLAELLLRYVPCILMCVKLEVPTTNKLEVIDINVIKREEIWLPLNV